TRPATHPNEHHRRRLRDPRQSRAERIPAPACRNSAATGERARSFSVACPENRELAPHLAAPTRDVTDWCAPFGSARGGDDERGGTDPVDQSDNIAREDDEAIASTRYPTS